MKRFRWLSVAILFIIVSSLLPLAFAGAAQADSGKINLQDLTNGADSVLVGTVIERHSYWNDEHTNIYTSVVMSVDDKLKGTVNQNKVTITVQGGEAEGIREFVSEMPSFDQGEKAVVFLKKLTATQLHQAEALGGQPSGEQYEVYAGFRGKFDIKGDRIDSLPLNTFKGRVNNILKGQVLPDTELYVTPPAVTMPFLATGYSWPSNKIPVGYRINENTAPSIDPIPAVQNAAATWSDAGANFSFSYAGATTAIKAGFDGVNEIVWKNMESSGILAMAYWWSYDGITIAEADIEFNNNYNWSTSPTCPGGYYDVQSVGLHELGHWVGLADLYGGGDADKVMYGYGFAGTTKRALTADDIAGILSIYGTALLTVTNATGASDITATSARLNGEVTSTGGENPTVHVYWGDNDGGTGTWDYDENLGIKGTGTFYKDISNLTYGTRYYYRCYATNSSKSDWADSTSLFTAGEQKLIGADDATANIPLTAGYVSLTRFQAVASGNVFTFKVKSDRSANVKVAIYDDSSGNPGALLKAVDTTGTLIAAGWNSINIDSTPVTSGAYYWLAINSDTTIGCGTASPGGTVRYKAAPYATFTFPNPADGGYSSASGVIALLAGYGSSGPVPLFITTSTLPDGTVNVPYSATLQATGGTGSYTWSIISGTLPDGLNLNTSTGLISGTPTTPATYNFTAQVNDGTSTASKPLSILVQTQKLIGADDATANVALTAGYVSLTRFQAVASGNVVTFKVKSDRSAHVKVAVYEDSSGNPGDLLKAVDTTGTLIAAGWNSISIDSTPVTSGAYYWLAINSDTTIGCGTASPGGTVKFKAAPYATFTFPDPADGGYSSASGVIALLAGYGSSGPVPLSITTSTLPDGTVNTPYSATLHATGGTGSYTWSIPPPGTLPDGLSLNLSTGLISGTPTTPATYNFTAQVNGGTSTASKPLSILVQTQKLIGADDAAANIPLTAGYVSLTRFQATANGNVTAFKVKSDRSAHVKVAIYDDSSGNPGALLKAVDTTGTLIAAGWNSINIDSTPVTSGAYYWLAINSDTTIVCGTASPGGTVQFKAAPYATFTFPDPADGGYTSASGVIALLAGYGSSGP